MSHPAYTQSEAQTRETFLAMMWSLSYPGRIYTIPTSTEDAFHIIADTLLDIETSFYTPDESFVAHLSRNGARPLTPDRAAYHFYATLTESQLDTVKDASIGTLMYPDQSATLIIGATIGTGQTLHLSGPGIPPDVPGNIQVGGLPAAFWNLRERAIRYPRGWDVYLVDGKSIVGLPRTTVITIEE